MSRKASIKETGEDISDEKWKRFEAAVRVGGERKGDAESEPDQRYRDEVERPDEAGGRGAWRTDKLI